MHIHNNRRVYFLSFTYIFYLLIESTKIKRLVNNRLCTYIMLIFPNYKTFHAREVDPVSIFEVDRILGTVYHMSSTLILNLKMIKWKDWKDRDQIYSSSYWFLSRYGAFHCINVFRNKRVTSWSLKVNLHLIANRKDI